MPKINSDGRDTAFENIIIETIKKYRERERNK